MLVMYKKIPDKVSQMKFDGYEITQEDILSMFIDRLKEFKDKGLAFKGIVYSDVFPNGGAYVVEESENIPNYYGYLQEDITRADEFEVKTIFDDSYLYTVHLPPNQPFYIFDTKMDKTFYELYEEETKKSPTTTSGETTDYRLWKSKQLINSEKAKEIKKKTKKEKEKNRKRFIKLYEEKYPGKHAIWQGEETKGFKEFVKNEQM